MCKQQPGGLLLAKKMRRLSEDPEKFMTHSKQKTQQAPTQAFGPSNRMIMPGLRIAAGVVLVASFGLLFAQESGNNPEVRVIADGRPAAWLFAGPSSGMAGQSLWGLDYEGSLRPNPGDPYPVTDFDSFATRSWRPLEINSDHRYSCGPLAHDYLWARGAVTTYHRQNDCLRSQPDGHAENRIFGVRRGSRKPRG